MMIEDVGDVIARRDSGLNLIGVVTALVPGDVGFSIQITRTQA